MTLGFRFSAEHEAVRETVRRMCGGTPAPLVNAAEEAETSPRHLFLRRGELGLLGVRYPETDGRSGIEKVSNCMMRDQLRYCSQAFASSRLPHSHLGIWRIWKAAAPALGGDAIAAFALSEPNGGSNVRALRTRAERLPAGWAIHGSKLYVADASIADFLLVAARTGAELEPEAISLFIVDLANLGVAISKPRNIRRVARRPRNVRSRGRGGANPHPLGCADHARLPPSAASTAMRSSA